MTTPLAVLLDEGERLFDAGAYWHAHEVWERAWKRDDAPSRDYWRGLIQLAASLYHRRRGNRRPVAWLLTRARHHLTIHDDPRWPYDPQRINDFIADLAAWVDGEERPIPTLRSCQRSGSS